MRKDTTTAKLTEYEIKRNKKISKKRYETFEKPCQSCEGKGYNNYNYLNKLSYFIIKF